MRERRWGEIAQALDLLDPWISIRIDFNGHEPVLLWCTHGMVQN